MRTFAIYNPLTRERRAAAWLHYDPVANRYAIEVADWATPADLPLMLALFAEDGRRDIGDFMARVWIAERIPPKDRENIDETLAAAQGGNYYLPSLLALTKGRTSLDDFLLEEVPAHSYRTYNLNRTLEAPTEVGVLLSRARRAADLTQSQLAEACGVQQAVISRIESGKANPTLETLETLAQGCGRTLRIMLE